MARKILWGSLALAPVTIAADFLLDLGDVELFVLASLALVPLAWLIGEATEHAAHHTGPGIGGFLNATFGNAPELIISLLAINKGLTEVVRGSLTGSVVGNILLVLGFSLLVGTGDMRLDRQSSFVWLGLILVATVGFLVPAIPSWHGDPTRHSLAVLSIPDRDLPARPLRRRHVVAAPPAPRAARRGRGRGRGLGACRARSASSPPRPWSRR